MRRENKNLSFGAQLLLTLIIAIICYLILMAALGPVLISRLGELYTRKAIFIITLIISTLFAISLSNDRKADNNADIRPKRKYQLLIFGLLALLMVPFGLAGVLSSRGHGDLPPLWGGGLCLVSGLILIYLYLTNRD
jgi:hypothetical protein